ncbi:hypothetical protein [Spirochaeta lutea]|uniref:PilZ domain-containing protein n=1 Tax=Spirochaeta lutea TaxID=1480694 RepID=A0A098QY69_9SPIO|nr:hypothetical protein [Spirochaeta lutea]KGE71432.1 hypothetical protein DC28_11620 [Spirochaeta lutea]
MEDQNSGLEARKVFILYPPSVVQEQLIEVLIQAEFEVAVIKDYRRIFSLMYKYPGSILFLNIEQRLPERDWDWLVDQIRADQAAHRTRLGILVYNSTDELKQHYLMEKGLECGFITLKLGIAESAKILLKTLEANEARGRRRYVRVRVPASKGSINVRYNGFTSQGTIMDISSVGMAAVLKPPIAKESYIDDIQLRLWGQISSVTGRVYGQRTLDSGEILHVILFEPAPEGATKAKLRSVIRKALQAEIDAE